MRRNEKITVLYERLSRDDDLQRESNSISNQKKLCWRTTPPGMTFRILSTLRMMVSAALVLTAPDF